MAIVDVTWFRRRRKNRAISIQFGSVRSQTVMFLAKNISILSGH